MLARIRQYVDENDVEMDPDILAEIDRSRKNRP